MNDQRPSLRPAQTFTTKWALGQHVHIDTDRSITATITGFCWRSTREPTVELSWFSNGDAKTAWVEENRLRDADD